MLRTCILSAAALGLATGAAAAEEQELRFTLVITPVEEAPLPAAAEGQAVQASRSVGVATFEDGRTAFKEFVFLEAGDEESGELTGYSTYTFEDGDALHVKFTGGWSPDGLGGDYEVVSGTGAFADATGTGRFDAIGDSWERAMLLDGSFNLEVPDS
ncbi:hypothetical protein [Aquisalimonas sp.]|uniref:hypothetical protein n=1 Tax=Aquisalimonas sp. TaxID=1872621 RepID=UPI0025BE74F7|nr:hypothetical protein [Aquisalimonas sp.]